MLLCQIDSLVQPLAGHSRRRLSAGTDCLLLYLDSVFFRRKYTADLPTACYMGAHPNVHPNNQHRHLFILQASRVEPCLSKELNAGIVSGLGA